VEAAGLHPEGITRGAQWLNSAYYDSILYAVLRDGPRQPD
jgi:RimJ/RimL family protein N-acetyltransferase